jgi:NADH-quinone oxidoreductase subunit M
VVGIVLTMGYLFRMMRGLFYGPMDEHYAHAHDAVSMVDRFPLLLMIACSIGFFFFPLHFYDVVRAGVDPLIARIIEVVPVVSQAGGMEQSHQLSAVSRQLGGGIGPLP